MQESCQANRSFIPLPSNSSLGYPVPMKSTTGITVIELGDCCISLEAIAESDVLHQKTENGTPTACSHLEQTNHQSMQSRNPRKRIVSSCIHLIRRVVSRMFCFLLHSRDVQQNHQAQDMSSTER